MAVVGWFEAGGALRISPRFFESASWIRFERSCSILEQRRDGPGSYPFLAFERLAIVES